MYLYTCSPHAGRHQRSKNNLHIDTKKVVKKGIIQTCSSMKILGYKFGKIDKDKVNIWNTNNV